MSGRYVHFDRHMMYSGSGSLSRRAEICLAGGLSRWGLFREGLSRRLSIHLAGLVDAVGHHTCLLQDRLRFDSL